MKAILLLAAAGVVHALPRPGSSVQDLFAAPSDDVEHHPALFHTDLTVDAVLAPFVEDGRFGWPFVNVHEDGGESTWRYDAEGSPATVADALRILRDDSLSFTLKYEHLDSAAWPAALAALLPPALRAELTTGNLETDGGLTVHAYVSAPGASALPEHDDVGDILVLHLAGEKAWSAGGTDVALTPGDGLWVPAGARHSARATSSGVSAHLTIHRVNEASEERRLNHINGDDGTGDDVTDGDDYKIYRDDYCGYAGSHDASWQCPCNLAVSCNDLGGYCLTKDKMSSYARKSRCCGYTDYDDDCGPEETAPADAYGWYSLDKEKDCSWIGKKPSERCDLDGVVPRDISHYGREWLFANNPRFKAKDACPVSCAGSSDVKLKRKKCKNAKKDKKLKDWSYDAGLDEPVGCEHVAADNTDKRCARIGTKGLPAKDACCKTCASYDCKEFGSSGVRCKKKKCKDDGKWRDKKKGLKCKDIKNMNKSKDRKRACEKFKDKNKVYADEACCKACK